MKFYYSPCDYSPEYYLESDGKRNLIKIISISSIEHDLPNSKNIPVEECHYQYFKETGWKKVLDNRDWLGLQT